MTLAFLFLTVAFLFLSSPLCYMLRFVSLPNKRRYIYIYFNSRQKLCCPTPSTKGRSSLRSIKRGGGYSLFLFPIFPKARPVHSWWLDLLCGMGFHWHSDCSSGVIQVLSTLA